MRIPENAGRNDPSQHFARSAPTKRKSAFLRLSESEVVTRRLHDGLRHVRQCICCQMAYMLPACTCSHRQSSDRLRVPSCLASLTTGRPSCCCFAPAGCRRPQRTRSWFAPFSIEIPLGPLARDCTELLSETRTLRVTR